jgi:hypothetical protein
MQAMLTVKLTDYFEPWRVPGLRVRERRIRPLVAQ